MGYTEEQGFMMLELKSQVIINPTPMFATPYLTK